MEQQTSSKSGKENVKAIYVHTAILSYMQSISCKILRSEAQAGIKISWENINNLRYTDDTTLRAKSKEGLKRLVMNVKEESEKSWLKTQHSEN